MMNQTIQKGYVPMRSNDVTADDTLLESTATTYRYGEFTKRDVFLLGPEFNACEIIFVAEADDTDYFQCRIWGGGGKTDGRMTVAEFICDMTGQAGTAYAGDLTLGDPSDLRFIDTLTIDTQGHIKTASIADSATNRVAKLAFDTVGLTWLYAEFEDVGDTTEVHRIMPYIRPF